ncbi:MAG: endolytic transglycosylase MltG [Anaerolineae bacterium]|nr:endolytic transglycosylase MltG [Anaerolineae bacterium]
MKNFKILFILVLCVVFLILLITVSGIVITLPSKTEKVFGPAGSDNGYLQKLGYSIRLFLVEDDLVKPLDANGKIKKFKIGFGDAPDTICQNLMENELIKNCDAFKLYLIYSGLDRGIQAGEYKLSASMNVMEIARTIQDYHPEDVSFNILAGWRLEEIAAALPTSGINISSDTFLNSTQSVNGVSLPDEYSDFTSFEGLLMPGSYTVKREIEIYALLTQFMQTFDEKVDGEIRAGFKQQGLTLHQAVILASIVEREAIMDEEKTQIASVFINRIHNGMKLESDPTVQYALGYNELLKTWWKTPLNGEDLNINSPYNTYLYGGLPPTPICNPGIKALRAVAFPDNTNFYFFRAKCDSSGLHNFSETYDEHVSKACP